MGTPKETDQDKSFSIRVQRLDGTEHVLNGFFPSDTLQQVRDRFPNLNKPKFAMGTTLLGDPQMDVPLVELGIAERSVLSLIARPPKPQAVLTLSADCTAKLWNTETGECSKTFAGHTGTL